MTCATPSPTHPLSTFLNQQKSQTGQLEPPTDALTKIIFIAKRNILCSPGTIIDSTSSKAFVALIITIAIKTSYHSYHIVWESLWYWQTSWADIRWWVQVQVLKSKRIKRAHFLLCLVEFDSKRIAFTQPLCTKPYLHNENLALEYINRHAQVIPSNVSV